MKRRYEQKIKDFEKLARLLDLQQGENFHLLSWVINDVYLARKFAYQVPVQIIKIYLKYATAWARRNTLK